MPDLFETHDAPDRDQRFRDDTIAETTTTTLPIEPAVAKDAVIPRINSPHFVKNPIPEDKILPIVRDENNQHINLFSSYAERPNHVSFHNQEDDEVILLFLRASLFTFFNWVIPSIIFIILPIILAFLNFQNIILSYIPFRFFILFILIYYHIVATYIFIKFLRWYFNICLITTKRIVDIDFIDLVYKNVAETKLALVQDVSYIQNNVASTVFNYGNVLIQTAGNIENFELHKVPRPERVVEILENLIGKGREEYGL